MTESKRYVLWGSAGHAKVLASIIKNYKCEIAALFDNNPNALSSLNDVPLFIGKEGFLTWLGGCSSVHNIIGLAAIGGSRGADRLVIHQMFQQYGLQTNPLIHSQASICGTAVIGSGSQVLAQAVVSSDVVVGEACIINHSANADHECRLEDGVHLAPRATLCGCVTVGKYTMVGAGAVVLPRVTIGENTIIGAGAVVLKDVPPGVVAVGNPARIIRTIEDHE